MGTNTKIIVLHSRKILYGAIFAFVFLCAVTLFLVLSAQNKTGQNEGLSETGMYEAGVYSSIFSLGENHMEICVYLDTDHINGISLSYLDDYVETMYPLMQPTFQDLAAQIVTTQNLSEVSYPIEQKYTSIALLREIYRALQLGAKK